MHIYSLNEVIPLGLIILILRTIYYQKQKQKTAVARVTPFECLVRGKQKTLRTI